MSLQLYPFSTPNLTIIDGPGDVTGLLNVEILASRSALDVLKTSLTPTQMVDILKPATIEADSFWRDLVFQSQGTAMIPADIHISLTSPRMNVSSFLEWYNANGGSPEVFGRAHPENYWAQTTTNPDGTTLRLDAIEGFDGHVTRFDMPTFGPPDRAQFPFLRPMPEYPIQVGGPLELLDGTLWGVSHTSFKEPDDAEGVELFTTTWLPSKSSEALVLDIRRHTMLDWVNWLVEGSEAVGGSGNRVARR
ncbi:hypothetical protein GQ53DRAFT_851277 [Thozetella sp. PMI_491]|nr:hypothetical protein GQ53DRAFT_851277 [Thozetella sp. PMI_491]